MLWRRVQNRQIFAAPGNGGIARQAELVPIGADDIAGLADFARNERIDLTFVGPEIPLSKGIVDLFREVWSCRRRPGCGSSTAGIQQELRETIL